MFCPKQRPYTRISQTLNKLYCQGTDCRLCSYSSFQIKDVLAKLDNKKTEGWKGYQKIIQFYNAAIQCLQMDRDKLLGIMKQHTYQFNDVQTRLIDFCKFGKPHCLNEREKRVLRSFLKNENDPKSVVSLIESEKIFFEIFQSIRNTWIPDQLGGFEEASRILRKYEESNFKKSLLSTVCLYKDEAGKYRKQTVKQSTELGKIRQLRFGMSSFSDKFFVSLNVLAPQIQSVIFDNNNTNFQNISAILQTLSRFKSLKVLKIQAHRPLMNFDIIFQSVQKLQLQFVNAEIVKSYSKYFPSVVELMLNNVIDTNGIWNFSNFKNLQRLKVDQIDCFQSFEDKELLSNLEYLGISGLMRSKNMASFLKILNLPKLKSLIIPMGLLQHIHVIKNLSHLKIDFSTKIIQQRQYFQNIRNLAQNNCLKSLWIDESNLDDINCSQFLPQLPELQLLSFQTSLYNQSLNITHRSIEMMGKYNRELLYLNLNNQTIGDRGAMNIGKYLTKLVYLSVVKCRIGNSGIAYLSKLKNLNTLITSNFSTKFSTQYRLNLRKILSNNRSLRNLAYITNSNSSKLECSKIIKNQIITISQTNINNKSNFINHELGNKMENIQRIQSQVQFRFNHGRQRVFEKVSYRAPAPRIIDIPIDIDIDQIQQKQIFSRVPLIVEKIIPNNPFSMEQNIERIYPSWKYPYSNEF